MLSVLAITIPIYACVAIGHLAVRRGILDRADMRVLATFVISFALPCMLFLAIATRPVADIVNPTYLTAYAIGSVLAFATGYTLARARGATAAERAFDGLGMSGSNSGFVGYPLLLLTIPTTAGLVLGLSMLVENLLVLPLMYLLAEGAASHGPRAARMRAYAARLTRNPLLAGLAAGLVVSLTGLHPALVLGALAAVVAWGMPALSHELRIGLVVTGALPIMSIMPVLASPYGEQEPIAGVLLVTTGVSFVTLSGLLAVLTG